jgi:hypothetical protein
MQSEFNWTIDDTSSLSTKLDQDHIPQRAALTGIGLFLKTHDRVSNLLLSNPHPESWNNWNFPYGSFSLPLSLSAGAAISFASLTATLEGLYIDNMKECLERVFREIGGVLGSGSLEFDDTALFSSFSLKYSKTAGLWTAYYFNYFRCLSAFSLPSRGGWDWLELTSDVIQNVVATKQYAGLPVAGNIPLLLSDNKVIRVLQSEV